MQFDRLIAKLEHCDGTICRHPRHLRRVHSMSAIPPEYVFVDRVYQIGTFFVNSIYTNQKLKSMYWGIKRLGRGV